MNEEYLQKAKEEIRRLQRELRKIAKKEHPNISEGGVCHWEGCNSPEIAKEALRKTPLPFNE